MIKIADLFAGIGGIRLGFEQAFGKENVECVFTSEINKSAIKTYVANFENSKVFGDISKIRAADIPDFDILLAGFPCQSFSIAGLKKGFEDIRGQAIFEIERVLKEKQPRVFLLENVPNLVLLNEGRNFDFIKARLHSAGYKISYAILSGKDFGVPQNRRRVFIVGYLDKNVNFEFPKPLDIKTSVAEVLEKSVDPHYILADAKWQDLQKRAQNFSRERLTIMKGNEPYSRTIIAKYSGNPTILVQNPQGNPRILTERECARLQGFPDSFILDQASSLQIYKQLGNSVCVPVIKAVAEQIKKTFFAKEEKNK